MQLALTSAVAAFVDDLGLELKYTGGLRVLSGEERSGVQTAWPVLTLGRGPTRPSVVPGQSLLCCFLLEGATLSCRAQRSLLSVGDNKAWVQKAAAMASGGRVPWVPAGLVPATE